MADQTHFLIGTGGWAYFQVPNKPSLRAYSDIFNFVEVNSTFYMYPDQRLVESWRRMAPADFTFSLRCHQDLTHRIGLQPVDQAFEVFYRMKVYCDILQAPFLVLETAATQTFDNKTVKAARDFFSSVSQGNVKIVWEYRAPVTPQIDSLMQDFGIVKSVDLSIQKPLLESEVVYSRVFGKGKHNLYQFTDDELVEIEQNATKSHAKMIAVSFHGARMYNDAARAQVHMRTGKFLQVTDFFGVDSAKAVLAEDTDFPASKAQLVEDQGWKVIDLTADKRVHLAEILTRIPEKTYRSVNEVIDELKGVM